MSDSPVSAGKLVGQAVVYGIFAVAVGYLATRPSYTYFEADKAQILVSFAHGGKPKGGCRTPTAEENAKLAPNMRRKKICSRERVELLFEMRIDGQVVFNEALPPTGLRSDGPSRFYRKFPVAAGRHDVVFKLRDSEREDGFDYVREARIELKPKQNLAVDFKAAQGGFRFE